MAKDFAELKERLETYVDDTVTEKRARMFFNQCNEDIARICGNTKFSESDFDKDVPALTLPPDFQEMMELKFKRDSQNNFLRVRPIGLVQPTDFYDPNYAETDGSTGYEIFGLSLELRADKLESGKLQLRYFAALPEVTDLTQQITLNVRFHDMYALFAAAKWYQNYQDELQAKQDYWGEYQEKRAELLIEYNRIKTRSASKTVYQFRTWR